MSSDPKKTITANSEEWRELAKRAANELDPDKLLVLAQRLCELLEKRNTPSKKPPTPQS